MGYGFRMAGLRAGRSHAPSSFAARKQEYLDPDPDPDSDSDLD